MSGVLWACHFEHHHGVEALQRDERQKADGDAAPRAAGLGGFCHVEVDVVQG